MRFSPGRSTMSLVSPPSMSRRGERALIVRVTSKGRSLRNRSGMVLAWLVTTTDRERGSSIDEMLPAIPVRMVACSVSRAAGSRLPARLSSLRCSQIVRDASAEPPIDR